MATIDVFQLIFQDILKIAPNLLYKYPYIQDQLFNLIFLPHVVLFLFLFSFGRMIVPEGRKDTPAGNRGLRYLVTATAYIFIVYQGWYGQILIPLFQSWFTIMLGFGLFLFLVTRIFHPATAQRLGMQVAPKITEPLGKQLARGNQLQALQKELDEVHKLMHINKRRIKDPANIDNAYVMASLKAEQKALEDKERFLKKQIEGF